MKKQRSNALWQLLVLVALVSGYNADITAYYEKLGVNKVNVTVNWYDTSRSVDVIDALYDYGNGELGDMVLGVSPDLSTSLPMKYRTTTLDSGTLYLGSDQFSVCGNYTLKEGRDISAFDVDRRSRVCVPIPKRLLRAYPPNAPPNPVHSHLSSTLSQRYIHKGID